MSSSGSITPSRSQAGASMRRAGGRGPQSPQDVGGRSSTDDALDICPGARGTTDVLPAPGPRAPAPRTQARLFQSPADAAMEPRIAHAREKLADARWPEMMVGVYDLLDLLDQFYNGTELIDTESVRVRSQIQILLTGAVTRIVSALNADKQWADEMLKTGDSRAQDDALSLLNQRVLDVYSPLYWRLEDASSRNKLQNAGWGMRDSIKNILDSRVGDADANVQQLWDELKTHPRTSEDVKVVELSKRAIEMFRLWREAKTEPPIRAALDRSLERFQMGKSFRKAVARTLSTRMDALRHCEDDAEFLRVAQDCIALCEARAECGHPEPPLAME